MPQKAECLKKIVAKEFHFENEKINTFPLKMLLKIHKIQEFSKPQKVKILPLDRDACIKSHFQNPIVFSNSQKIKILSLENNNSFCTKKTFLWRLSLVYIRQKSSFWPCHVPFMVYSLETDISVIGTYAIYMCHDMS